MATTLEEHLTSIEAEILDSYTCPLTRRTGPAFSMVWVADDPAWDEAADPKPDFVSGVVWHERLMASSPVETPTPCWDVACEIGNAVRAERQRRLSASDWTQGQDSPLDPTAIAAWALYRTELRDLPQTYADPSSVVWPTQPL